ncbi:unnamed protein product, partial [Phaeothamnion confervicola]
MPDQPAYSILGGREGPLARSTTPGPGERNESTSKSASLSSTLATAERFGSGGSLALINTPGPGSYNVPSRIGRDPGFSLKSRPVDRIKENGPGPGAFLRPKTVPERAPGGALGRATRGAGLGSRAPTPGAGEYDVDAAWRA